MLLMLNRCSESTDHSQGWAEPLLYNETKTDELRECAMNNFFNNLNDKLQTFMMGRNGSDKLGMFALGGAVVLMLINVFIPNILCSMVSYALLFYAIYRTFSSNVAAREAENDKFEAFLGRFTGGSKDAKSSKSAKDDRSGSAEQGGSTSRTSASKATDKDGAERVQFTCEQCGQSLSVPKGKGTLKVTCPKCHHQTKVES